MHSTKHPWSGITKATTCTGGNGISLLCLKPSWRKVYLSHNAVVLITPCLAAGYPIPPNPGGIRLCASGRSGDGNVQTLCVNALDDNSFGGDPSCPVIKSQTNVTDECYVLIVVIQNPSSVISVPALLPTSCNCPHHQSLLQ